MTAWRSHVAGAAALASLSACAYYNAMWSAERFAKQARQAEERGQVGEARGWWQRAAVKAESVVARHPGSRWADDAMVLRAEALVRGGRCADAAGALARARALPLAGPLRERADLAAAECALAGGRPREAEGLLAPLLASADDARRSRAAFLAGSAAWDRRDAPAALDLLGRSTHPGALPARIRVLLAGGEGSAALTLVDTLARRPFVEAQWTALLEDAARELGPATAADALDRLVARGRLPADAGARLLLADADRLAAAGADGRASDRYTAAERAAPEGATVEAARVRRLRVRVTQATSLDDIARLAGELDQLAARSSAEGPALALLLARVRDEGDPVTAFRAAELARDSLRAPALAGRLFLDLAGRAPASLFAPKALVAAMALLPVTGDSLNRVLDSVYAMSPYTRALRGEATPAFAAAEDSLARALGVARGAAVAVAPPRVAPPTPGPRGVAFDPWTGVGPPAAHRGAAGRTPAAARPPQPAPLPPRPTERP